MAVSTLTNENRAEYNASKGFEPKAEDPPVAAAAPVVEAEESEEEKHSKSVKTKFEKLRAERNEARAAIEETKKERDELKAKLDAIEGKAAETEPKPDKYTDPVEYAKDLAKWMTAKERKEDAVKAQAAKEEADRKKVVDAWNKEYSKVSKQYDDWQEVMADPLNLEHGTVIDAIYESEIGPHINYYLSKNRDEAEKLNEMGVKAALKYLGRIEAKIEGQLDAAKEEKKAAEEPQLGTIRRKIGNAPAPITPLKGGNSVGLASVNGNGEFTGSYREFKDQYKKGLIR